MASARPYFRAPLHPVLDLWSGGPGVAHEVIRFALWAGWEQSTPDQRPAAPNTIRRALLYPEIPFSVLPFSVRQGPSIRYDVRPPEAWRGRPTPRWRGVACQVGTAVMRLNNERPPRSAEDFPLLVLLPEQDPPGPPPQHVLLGAEFFTHYDMRVVLDYRSVGYDPDASTGGRRLDATARCGHLEIR